ncbi:MAG: nucleoside deaminase [Alphaproteobacteria bacterium]|nr:nucleoside deaminase [Alphaproteobacteria bacterium]
MTFQPDTSSIHDRCCRRAWLRRLAAAPLGALVLRPAAAVTPAVDGAEAAAFIEMAFEAQRQATAAGDQPYGAVVVKDGELVVATPSRVVTAGDPTAHAEMEALRDAARHLGTRDLSGCILYSSSRPCPMCEAAAYWAGIERLVHGRAITDAGAPTLRRC